MKRKSYKITSKLIDCEVIDPKLIHEANERIKKAMKLFKSKLK